MTLLTACASGGRARPADPRVVPKATITGPAWRTLSGIDDGEVVGAIGLAGGREAALVGHKHKDGARWVVVVARDPRTAIAVIPVVVLPLRADRPRIAKAHLVRLRVGDRDLVRADVSFVEEQAPHGFATRTVIVAADEEPPRVLLDRLSEVGSDEAQKLAKISAADVDGDGRYELVFEEKTGVERRRVVYHLGAEGYRTRDPSLFLSP